MTLIISDVTFQTQGSEFRQNPDGIHMKAFKEPNVEVKQRVMPIGLSRAIKHSGSSCTCMQCNIRNRSAYRVKGSQASRLWDFEEAHVRIVDIGNRGSLEDRKYGMRNIEGGSLL